MISTLSGLDLKNRNSYGNKACALGVLIKEGHNVPEGFSLSSEFFMKYLQYNKISFNKERCLAYNKEIYEDIINGEFSKEMDCELLSFFKILEKRVDGSSYAVRSSALCEDSEFYSMAGMFSSFINLSSFEEIKDGIKHCYGSLFQDKVIDYFIKNNLDFKDLKMGVIIQKFITGEHSGVNFSVDTMDMDDEVMNLNVVNGICDNFVSGKKSSAFYKVHKNTGEILEERLPNGFSELSKENLKELQEVTLTIENIFKKPQDVEWTIRENKLYILQARPITTFKIKGFTTLWINKEDENYTWYREADRPYEPLINELNLILGEALNKGFYEAGFKDFYSEYCVQKGYFFYRDKDMKNAKDQKENFLKYIESLHKENKNIFQDIILPKILDFNIDLENPKALLEKSIEYMKFLASKHQLVTHGCDYLEEFMDYCKRIDEDFNTADFYDLVFNVSILNKEREFYIRMAYEVQSNEVLYKMFEECPYDEILYNRLKKSEESGYLFELIEAYLKDFGICVLESEVSSPYFHSLIMEEPSKIMGNIRSLLHSSLNDFNLTMQNSFKNKAKVKERMLRKTDNKEEFLRRLQLGEKAYLVRDNHHYYFERRTKSYVRLALEKAKTVLMDKEAIESGEDLYFLTLDEIKEGLVSNKSFGKIINERKEIFNYEKTLLVPEVIGKSLEGDIKGLSEVKENYERNINKDPILLKGLSGLRKTVTGKVRVGIPSYLEEESILVLPFTRCGDITPIIKYVKGIVVEVGSPFEHLGIIAREMNIPVIYNVKNAMDLLKEGDWVKLDGKSGEILVYQVE